QRWDGLHGRRLPVNVTRLRLEARRRRRRLHALMVLVGVIVATGVAVSSRGGVLTGGAAPDPFGSASEGPRWSVDWLPAGRRDLDDEAGGYGGGDAADNEWDGDGASAGPQALLQGEAEEAVASADGGGADPGGAASSGKPVQIFTHEVRPGETLSHIAAAYGVDVETI